MKKKTHERLVSVKTGHTDGEVPPGHSLCNPFSHHPHTFNLTRLLTAIHGHMLFGSRVFHRLLREAIWQGQNNGKVKEKHVNNDKTLRRSG